VGVVYELLVGRGTISHKLRGMECAVVWKIVQKWLPAQLFCGLAKKRRES